MRPGPQRHAASSGATRAIAFGILAAVTTPAPAGQTLPVPIEKGICYRPEIHDRVLGHLLFSYVVTATGRVENVRSLYVRVEPAADETKLVAALRQCMQGWKFKPGVREGQPTAIAMMTPFHFFKPAPPDDPEVPIPGGDTIGQSRLQEMRQEKLGLIDHLLSGRQYIEERGAGWILKTDLGRKDANVVREALETAARVFAGVFPGLPPVPEALPVTVVAFRDTLAYDQVVAFDNLVAVKETTAGRYSPLDRIIYAAKGTKPTPILSELLVHEMTHHLVRQRLYAGTRNPPTWVNEGIASFVECLKAPAKGGIHPGALERGRVVGGPFIYQKQADAYLDALREAVKQGRMPPVAELLAGRLNSAFEGPRWEDHYGTSWLVVHYLVNAGGGEHRARFQAWMTGPDGEGDGESLAKAIGRPLEQIEADLPGYLKTLK